MSNVWLTKYAFLMETGIVFVLQSLLNVLEQPLLFWETFGPVVRAAATAHPQEIPAALALVGTEMAETAVNFIPSGDGNVSRTAGCNQQQGVLVLSAALRLVQAADISQGARKRKSGEGGLYTQWFTSCFGPRKGEDGVPPRADQADVRPGPQGTGSGYETRVSESPDEGSRLSGSEVCVCVLCEWFHSTATSGVGPGENLLSHTTS